MTAEFNSLVSMLRALPNDKACREYLEMKRWGGVPVCPHCGTQDANHYKLNVKGEFRGMYKCRACKQRFTVTLGTMFEGSPISLQKWFIATYIFSAHKKGISSHQLARDLDVTQKTAWFMLHRLRETFMDKSNDLMGGEGVIVEADSTIVGGKLKNMHRSKRMDNTAQGKRMKDNKTIVTAYVERGGSVRFDVKDFHEKEKELLEKHVDKGSFLMTDDTHVFNKIGEQFAGHEKVNHTNEEYVRDGYIHTNTIEGAFSLLDRMIIGIYHSVSPKHLQTYCNEIGFRYNTRKITDKMRFDMALVLTNGSQLKYTDLIGKKWRYQWK